MVLNKIFGSTNLDSNRKHFVAIFLLFIFTFVFFREGLVLNSRTVNWDTGHAFYPNMYFAGNMLRNFDLPLWNPYLFTGYPAYANIQSANFYPINFLFLLVTDFTAKAVYFYGAIHFSWHHRLCIF